MDLYYFGVDGRRAGLDSSQLVLGICKALTQPGDNLLPFLVKFERRKNQPPGQEQNKQAGVGEESCVRCDAPLVVAQRSTQTCGNEARRNGAEASLTTPQQRALGRMGIELPTACGAVGRGY